MNEEKYTFSYECGDTVVTMELGQGLDVREMCEQFENFLLATGFRLRDGESIGVTDETRDRPDDEMDDRELDEDELDSIGRYLEGIAGDVGHGSTFKFDADNMSSVGARGAL